MITYSFTGHRPTKIGGYGLLADAKVQKFAVHILEKLRARTPDMSCISGMALGWDMAVAEGCITLGIPFTAAIPFPQQPDIWPIESQEKWKRLVDRAQRKEILEQHYSAAGLQRRNEWMVNHSDILIALWNGGVGGTTNCILYANKVNKPVKNTWGIWEKFNPIGQ